MGKAEEEYSVEDERFEVNISRREGYDITQGVFHDKPEIEDGNRLIKGSVQTSRRRYNYSWSSLRTQKVRINI